MGLVKKICRLLLCSTLGLIPLMARCPAASNAPSEYEVKAVFVFNFSHFIAWPSSAFATADQPFVIGVLGSDPFGPHLEAAVRGEQVDAHPLIVRHFHDIADISNCQILFIDRSEHAQLDRVISALDHRSVLTVSDQEGASQQGVMIQFTTKDNQIHLRINAASAHAAGLTVSSNLMRLADIVGTRGGL